MKTIIHEMMASLKWEIIEQLPQLRRDELSETAYDDFIKSIITLNAEYTLTVEDIKAEAFHPKDLTEPTEAFGFMKKLLPEKENAFLFKKEK